MKNIDRLAQYMTKNGSDSFLIHTIYGTKLWIIAQKIEDDKWTLSLADPMGNITHNLGFVDDAGHYELWQRLTIREVEKRMSFQDKAKELRNIVKNFKKEKTLLKKLIKTTHEFRSNRSSKNSNRSSKK